MYMVNEHMIEVLLEKNAGRFITV